MRHYERAFAVREGETRLFGISFIELLAADRRSLADITGHAIDLPPDLVMHTSRRLGAEVTANIGGAVPGQSYDVVFRLSLTNPAGSGGDVEYRRTIRLQGVL